MSAQATVVEPIAVIGLGNVLLGDDGFGPTVVEWVRSHYRLPPGVALIDAGTPGLDLASYLIEREAVLLVDTVASTGEQGELRIYRGDELRRLPLKPRVSPHDPALGEALGIAELAGAAPHELVLIGAIPESVDARVSLGARMRGAVTGAATLVIAELERLGVHVVRGTTPAQAPPWWSVATPEVTARRSILG